MNAEVNEAAETATHGFLPCEIEPSAQASPDRAGTVGAGEGNAEADGEVEVAGEVGVNGEANCDVEADGEVDRDVDVVGPGDRELRVIENALTNLVGVLELPIEEQAERYRSVHAGLQDALSDSDSPQFA